MTLGVNQQRTLRDASRSTIRDSISQLTRFWSANAWLSTRNRYIVEASDKVERDGLNNDSFVHSHLVDYVAASVFGHCYDGWSYLARALEAEMSGDPDAARHLGYYAELRAAMSLLAAEGVGVFNHHHAVVLATGRCRSIRGGPTHGFTWDALEYWASLPRSANAIFKAIRPAGIPLESWLQGFGGSGNFLATSWLKEWGLDLARLGKDRDARNLASYRPTAFTSPGPRSIPDTVAAVAHLWSLCSPGSRGEFSSMDRHLLRLALRLLFTSKTGRSPKQAIRIYATQVAAMLNEQMISDAARTRLYQLLLYETEGDTPDLFVAAGRNYRPTHIDHSRQVLARATLLLRVATGSLATLLKESNTVFRTDLVFWWTKPAMRRRLWPTDAAPATFSDLWDDANEAVQAVSEWSQMAPDPECGKSFWTQHSSEASTLATPERIFLWGISQ